MDPVWSPDGKSIVYASTDGASPHLVRRALTGTTSEQLIPPGGFQFPGSFTSDGATLYFRQFPWGRPEVFRLDMRTRKAEPVLSNFLGRDPMVSPDGRWLAFSSGAADTTEVYLQDLSSKDIPRMRISTHGGQNPQWSQSGELFYLSSQNVVLRVVPRVTGDWSDAINTELFTRLPTRPVFAASPDGQSFLFITGKQGVEDSLFHVILGWQ
jgi:Tol biopolymer transport system component